MTRPASFDRELLAARQRLRAFCLGLTKDADRADDLVQDTIVRAMVKWTHYDAGTHMVRWLTVLARGIHIDQYRTNARRWGVVIVSPFDDPEALDEADEGVPGEQEPHILLADVIRILKDMGPIHYQAMMAAADGAPYKIAAYECGIPEGTLKSRVNRARERLVEMVA